MKINYNDMLKEGSIKKDTNINFILIERLIKRAVKDLEVAKKNLQTDQPTALDLVYKSMFHAANALIHSQGLRPGKFRQHIGVIEATSRTLGTEVKSIISKFDRLRQKRNEFEYQGLYRGTKTEIKNSFKDAQALIEKIEKYIQKKNPQKKFTL